MGKSTHLCVFGVSDKVLHVSQSSSLALVLMYVGFIVLSSSSFLATTCDHTFTHAHAICRPFLYVLNKFHINKLLDYFQKSIYVPYFCMYGNLVPTIFFAAYFTFLWFSHFEGAYRLNSIFILCVRVYLC